MEFNSNDVLGKRLRKKIRKNYKRYKIGVWVGLLFAAILAYIDWTVFNRLEGETFNSRIILCLGISIVPVILIIIIFLIAFSGGAETSSKKAERVIIDDKFLLYEYVPDARNMPAVDLVCYRYEWDDISLVYYEPEFSRLTIDGSGYLIKYKDIRQGNKPGNAEKSFQDKLSVVLYDNFDNFEKMKREMEKRAGVEIEKNDE